MARVADIAGPGLLNVPGQWRLPTGASRVTPLRWGGHVLLSVVTAILISWLVALIADARAGQGDWLTVVIAGLLGSSWLTLVLRLWRGLRHPGDAVTLAWGGLPPHRPSRPQAEAFAQPIPLPGWSVREWHQPVSVHVVFDLGAWLLVKVRGHNDPITAWSWLDARLAFQGPSGHHWRALLFSRQANDVGAAQPGRADVTVVVASCGDMQRQWAHLLSSFKTAARGQPRAMAAGDDFAPTQVLDPAHTGRRP